MRKIVLKTEIDRYHGMEIPGDGPRLAVVPKDVGKTVLTRYLQYKKFETVPSGKCLVAILRSDRLSNHDKLQVTRASREGTKLKIEIETRHYIGTLFANVMDTALIQIELGDLACGDYGLTVVETKLHFEDIDHPEEAANPITTAHDFKFKVCGNEVKDI